jgi:hypothetical protein
MDLEKLKTNLGELEKSELEEIQEYIIDLRDLDSKQIASKNYGSKELKEEFRKLDSVWSSESQLRTWATIKILEQLEKLNLNQNTETLKLLLEIKQLVNPEPDTQPQKRDDSG